MSPADLFDPVLDTTRALAVLQTRLHGSGLSTEQKHRRTRLVHELERVAPDVALIAENWMDAGSDARLEIRGSHDVWLHSSDGTIHRRWRVSPDTILALSPLLG